MFKKWNMYFEVFLLMCWMVQYVTIHDSKVRQIICDTIHNLTTMFWFLKVWRCQLTSFDSHCRGKRPIFSAVEAEELIEIIICLFLDRQFQGLLVLLNDCMQAIVNYFTDQEWCSSCENIAKFIASRLFLLIIVLAFICWWWYIILFLVSNITSDMLANN